MLAGYFPRLLPPTGAGWTRYGAVLSASVAWEQTSIQEPDIIIEDGIWKMWAKGGWATTALGYYTSEDGLTWSRYTFNPVLGGGGSSYAPEISQPTILKVGATYYCYFNSGGDSDPNTPRYATSTDGIAWTVGGSGTFITNPGSLTQWGNRHVWKEGSSWYMLQEARNAGTWNIYYATSTDGLSWTLGNGSSPLSTLQPTGGWNYGGPEMLDIPTISGVYHLWYHTGPGTTSNLYHATSTDRITWTITPATPVLTRTGTGTEIDQVADPAVLVVGSKAYNYYAGVDNTGQTGVILLATGTATT